MGTPAIRLDGLWKQYRLGEMAPYNTLRDTLAQVLRAPRRALRAFGRHTGASTRPAPPRVLWALRDITLEVKAGEAMAVVGRNGSGKSTLLKVLARITEPTRGSAEIRGRVGAMLELGTGFHPELTGRENIVLNGILLGMTRREIRHHFDEIVAFSELEKFIDTPVKHYSSGMYLRLAFSVAAHFRPEVLLLDEVFSVGDQDFREKCHQKLRATIEEGATVLLVTHDLGIAEGWCRRALWLDAGQIRADGPSSEVVRVYGAGIG